MLSKNRRALGPVAGRWHILAAAGLALLEASGCQPPRSGIALTVKGLSAAPGFQELQVTVQRGADAPRVLDAFPREQLEIRDDEATLGLDLTPDPDPDAPFGAEPWKISVAAADPTQAWVLASGELAGLAPRRGRSDAEVTLRRTDLCSQGGWCWELPTPTGRYIYSLWGAAPDDIWAAGAFGTLLHFDGRLWSPQKLPEEAGEMDLYALWGRGRDDVWVVGGQTRPHAYQLGQTNRRAVVLHYDGQRWSSVLVPAPEYTWFVAAGGGDRGETWLAGIEDHPKDVRLDLGFLLRCTPAGCESQRRYIKDLIGQAETGSAIVWDLWTGASGPLWAAGTSSSENFAVVKGIVLHQEGDRWAVEQLPSATRGLQRIVGEGADVYAGAIDWDPPRDHANANYTWRRDSGGSWQQVMPAPAGAFPRWLDRWGAAWGFSGSALYARPGGVGGIWSRVDSAPLYLSGLIGFSTTDIWVAGSKGQILHLDGNSERTRGSLPVESGATGSRSSGGAQRHGCGGPGGPGPTACLHGMYGTSARAVWAVGEDGTILGYDGAAWTPEESGTVGALRAVAGFDAELWAVGDGGTILRRRGSGWVREAQNLTTRDLYAIWGTGPGDLWAVGDGGTILRYDGTAMEGSWTKLPTAPFSDVRSIFGAGSARWIGGCTNPTGNPDDRTPAMGELQGGVWMSRVPPVRPGYCVTELWRDGDGLLYAQTTDRYEHGDIYQSKSDNSWGNVVESIARGHWSALGPKDLWVSLSGRDGLLRGSDKRWEGFYAGAAPYGPAAGGLNLYSLGQDVWLYGDGILHCKKGVDCAQKRR